jgi:hypothetical protein
MSRLSIIKPSLTMAGTFAPKVKLKSMVAFPVPGKGFSVPDTIVDGLGPGVVSGLSMEKYPPLPG